MSNPVILENVHLVKFLGSCGNVRVNAFRHAADAERYHAGLAGRGFEGVEKTDLLARYVLAAGEVLNGYTT